MLHAVMQCLVYRCKYSNTQNYSGVRGIGRMGHYTGIPRSCLSIFKLQVIVLLSRLMLLRLVKSTDSKPAAKTLGCLPEYRYGLV